MGRPQREATLSILLRSIVREARSSEGEETPLAHPLPSPRNLLLKGQENLDLNTYNGTYTDISKKECRMPGPFFKQKFASKCRLMKQIRQS